MVIDYEAAWIELSAVVAGKSQHGRSGLLVEMASIAERHRVPAGETSRLLRLYGIEVEHRRAAEMQHEPDTAERLVAGLASDADADRPAHHDHIGGHDVRAVTAGSRTG